MGLGPAVPPQQQNIPLLTFDCIQDPAVQGLPAGIARGGPDSSSAAVGKGVPAGKAKEDPWRGDSGDSHCPALLPSGSGREITRILRQGMGNAHGNGIKCSSIIKKMHRSECRGGSTRDTGLNPREMKGTNPLGEHEEQRDWTYRSKKVARRRLSSTLCLTPAHKWQFISCPRVM